MKNRYCEKCGEVLVYYAIKAIGYTPDTGKKIYKAVLECPNRKHWFDGHSKWDGIVIEGSDVFEYDMKYSDF